MTEKHISVEGNAKINLTLDILGTRPDGFHEVSMVMQEVSLHDTLELTATDGEISLSIECLNRAELEADETNLCWRAAKLIQDDCGVSGGVKMKLIKRIPIAAGLAGGSTDAAAVLKGMNQLYELHLDEAKLCELGAKLGSDIPFCIMGGTMLATGRGEVLTRLPNYPETWLVLAKPPIGVSTAWAYKTYDSGYDGSHPDNEAMMKAIEKGDTREAASLICNVLEQVTEKARPEINEYKKLMLENGAIASMMSGSGPTVFGLCGDESNARSLAEVLKASGIDEVHVAKTVERR